MTFTSGHALLDVSKGRAKVSKRVKDGEHIPVVIYGYITDHWGADDGTSIEFVVDVVSAKEVKRIRAR